jgi:hypothetical protein
MAGYLPCGNQHYTIVAGMWKASGGQIEKIPVRREVVVHWPAFMDGQRGVKRGAICLTLRLASEVGTLENS